MKNLNIIVEGPDGSGKSTLAKFLSDRTGKEIFHSGGPPKSQEEIQARLLSQMNKTGFILDRCTLISEPVYGSVIRKEFNIPNWIYWVKEFINRDWIIYYCRPRKELLLDFSIHHLPDQDKNYKSKNHITNVREHYNEIIEAYDKIILLVRQMGMEVFYYVWDKSIIRIE